MAKRALTEQEIRQLRRFASRIRALREGKGLSQAQIAEMASSDGSSISLRYINDLENARRNPSFANALRVLEVLGIKKPETIMKSVDPRHAVLHDRLQEMLEAGGDWPKNAKLSVDGVWALYQDELKKRAS